VFGINRAATPVVEAPNGKYFMAVYFGVGLVVGMLRLRNPLQRKN
jgi:hypothetical protein